MLIEFLSRFFFSFRGSYMQLQCVIIALISKMNFLQLPTISKTDRGGHNNIFMTH